MPENCCQGATVPRADKEGGGRWSRPAQPALPGTRASCTPARSEPTKRQAAPLDALSAMSLSSSSYRWCGSQQGVVHERRAGLDGLLPLRWRRQPLPGCPRSARAPIRYSARHAAGDPRGFRALRQSQQSRAYNLAAVRPCRQLKQIPRVGTSETRCETRRSSWS